MENGQLEIYTGYGKGKTTAAFGLAVRALGRGMKVYIGEFIKDMEYGEVLFLKGKDNITLELYGTGRGCLIDRDAEKRDFTCAEKGMEKIIGAAGSGEYDIVIADEILTAFAIGLLTEQNLLDIAARRCDETELVMTGTDVPKSLVEVADLVTEMKEIKHYYREKNLLARDGIER